MIDARTKATLDFAMRLAFFAAAPFLLVLAAALFPVTGALVQIGLALGVFFAGEWARRLAGRSKIVRVLLRVPLAFEAYYREHPPRPFLYYVFYPFLFPYWLSVPEARREFLLFKGYTLVSFLLLVGSLVAQYLSLFPPELTLRHFGLIAAGTLLVETVIVLMFLMPIVTTVVHLHRARAPRRLGILLVVALVSVGFAGARLSRRRDPIVSFATRERARMRTAARPAAAKDAQILALREAWKALPRARDDVDYDGKVVGYPLEHAREGLGRYYRSDEIQAFDLWYSKRKGKGGIMVIYLEAGRKRGSIWLAMDRSGKPTHDVKELPRGAFVAMRHATE